MSSWPGSTTIGARHADLSLGRHRRRSAERSITAARRRRSSIGEQLHDSRRRDDEHRHRRRRRQDHRRRQQLSSWPIRMSRMIAGSATTSSCRTMSCSPAMSGRRSRHPRRRRRRCTSSPASVACLCRRPLRRSSYDVIPYGMLNGNPRHPRGPQRRRHDPRRHRALGHPYGSPCLSRRSSRVTARSATMPRRSAKNMPIASRRWRSSISSLPTAIVRCPRRAGQKG